jgi:chorismate mutase
MNLDDIRSDIDTLDAQLVQLLEARMTLVSQVATFKKMTGGRVLDNSRELVILDRVASQVENLDYAETVVNTFKDILKNSRAYQEKVLKNENLLSKYRDLVRFGYCDWPWCWCIRCPIRSHFGCCN